MSSTYSAFQAKKFFLLSLGPRACWKCERSLQLQGPGGLNPSSTTEDPSLSFPN